MTRHSAGRRTGRKGLGVLAAAVLFPAMLVMFPVAADAADISPPTQPGAITTSALTGTGVKLAWAASKDDVGIEGYRVYRGPASAANSALSLIATTDAVTSYTATRLYAGTAYKFGVVAIDAANNKSPMSTVAVTTPSVSDTTAPADPSSGSVTVKAFSSSRVDVTWGASTSTDVAGYQVWRDGAKVGQVDLPNGLRYSDTGLTASSPHQYVVHAVDSAGNVSTTGTPVKSVTTLATGAVIIARGPYLSNVSGTSATVSWWTNLVTPGVVNYGLAATSEHSQADALTTQHHSMVLTGLAPGSGYKYQVVSGAATVSAAFATAAAPGTRFSFAAIGDFGGGSAGETQNGVNIAAAGTSFIQTVGDNIYPSSGLPDPNFTTTYSDVDARFFKPFAAAAKGQSFFPANGNKEYYGDGEFWDTFPMPGTNHAWYSYDWGDAHILVVDSEQPFTAGSAQYAFIQADLAAHQSATWRIVAIQRPPYSSSSANSSSVPVRTTLVPLFEADHVNLVLSGNSHNYERTTPMLGGVTATNGVTYVVTGAGGNGFNTFTIAQPAYTVYREASIYEYTKVTVSPTSLDVAAITADAAGTVLDQFSIPASAPPVMPAPPTNLTATPNGSTAVNLAWTASSTAAVTGYDVYRGGVKITPTPVVGTTYPDSGLTPATSYSYQVRAVDGAGTESDPATASATTGSGPTTLTLAATNDATISAVNPTTNYGTGSTLQVDADGTIQDVVLKFAVPTSCTATAATLTLTVGSAANNNSAHGGDFYAAPDNGWTEGAVTFATAPAKTGSPVSLGAVALGTSYSLNVTPLLAGGLSGGVLDLRATTTSTDAAAYVSRNITGGSGPSLSVTCA